MKLKSSQANSKFLVLMYDVLKHQKCKTHCKGKAHPYSSNVAEAGGQPLCSVKSGAIHSASNQDQGIRQQGPCACCLARANLPLIRCVTRNSAKINRILHLQDFSVQKENWKLDVQHWLIQLEKGKAQKDWSSGARSVHRCIGWVLCSFLA